MANSVDPDQTAPIGAVSSGSTLFPSIPNWSVMLGIYLQQTISADDIFRCIFFLGALRVKSRIGSFLLCMSQVCLYYTSVITCWERADLLAFLCLMFPCVLVCLGQVWYLIISIPDLVFPMHPILNENSESNLVRPAKEVHALEGWFDPIWYPTKYAIFSFSDWFRKMA